MSVCKREIASRLCDSVSAVGAGGLLLTRIVVDALVETNVVIRTHC